jgi:2-methylcitrate dehydratase PrpD
MVCHGLDFDDTHSDSGSHISTVIAPAAFAAAELYGASGRDVLAAIVAGNEIACRIGMAAPGAFHARGFHPTAIGGVFGATAAVSRLAGFDAETATSALGIAGSMASGIFAYLADGTPTKPIHPGWAAHGAHIATRLAHHGAAGPRSVFDAQFGIYHAYLGIEPGSVGPRRSARGSREPLGNAADRVQALPDLPLHPRRRRRRSRRGGGAHLRGGRDRRGRRQRAGALGADRARARRREEGTEVEYEGKFSLQYAVASMLVRGHVGVTDFTEAAIADPDVLALAAKVSHEPRDFATYPEAFPGAAQVVLASGETLERELPFQKGAPENPWSADDVRAKFRANAELALPAETAAALKEDILALEQVHDLTAALAPLTLQEVATV